MGGMTAGHFIFIPAVFLLGLVVGWLLGSRAAADAYAAEFKRREDRARRPSPPGAGLAAVVLAAALACASPAPTGPDAAAGSPVESVEVERQLFDVDARRIGALVAGDPDAEEVIVLLASRGCGAMCFLDFLPRLARAGLHAVALDPRGVDPGEGLSDSLTLHDLARDVAGVIEQLDAGPVHVLGHGFGNRVARCLAADRPDLVAGLVLLGAGGQVPGDAEARDALQRLSSPGLSDDETLAALQTALFAPGSDASAWADIEVIPEVVRMQGAASRETPREEWVAGADAQMLVIQGRHDRIAPPANGRWLRERFGDRVRLVELANAGHALLPEQPDAILHEIVQFVRRDRR